MRSPWRIPLACAVICAAVFVFEGEALRGRDGWSVRWPRILGATLVGIVAGGLIGIVGVLLMPRRRVTCPQCQAPDKSAYRSLFDGREHPNECAACKHTWTDNADSR